MRQRNVKSLPFLYSSFYIFIHILSFYILYFISILCQVLYEEKLCWISAITLFFILSPETFIQNITALMFKYSSIQIIKYLANSRLGVQTASIYSALSPLAATSGNPNTVVHKPPTTIYLSANFLIYFCIISNWSLMGDGPTPFNIFSIVTPGNPTLWCTSLLQ